MRLSESSTSETNSSHWHSYTIGSISALLLEGWLRDQHILQMTSLIQIGQQRLGLPTTCTTFISETEGSIDFSSSVSSSQRWGRESSDLGGSWGGICERQRAQKKCLTVHTFKKKSNISFLVCDAMRDIIKLRKCLVKNEQLWKLITATILNTCQISVLYQWDVYTLSLILTTIP